MQHKTLKIRLKLGKIKKEKNVHLFYAPYLSAAIGGGLGDLSERVEQSLYGMLISRR